MRPEADRVRAFVALEIEERMRDRIVQLAEGLRGRLPGVHWVRPEGIHLTLRFLGQSSRARIESLSPRLAAAARACPPSEAHVSGLGMFPERGSPRVLWLGVAVAAPVLALQATCEEASVGAGFPPEPRPFRSHLTLGRWRDRAPRPQIPPADLGTVALATLTVFRSELQRAGAVYTPLARFPLGG